MNMICLNAQGVIYACLFILIYYSKTVNCQMLSNSPFFISSPRDKAKKGRTGDLWAVMASGQKPRAQLAE